MIQPRWRKVLADLWSNKTRTFLMVLTIFVGVFAVGLVNNMGRMMNHDMDADYQSANPSEAKIYAYPLGDDWVRALGKVPGVGDELTLSCLLRERFAGVGRERLPRPRGEQGQGHRGLRLLPERPAPQ